MSECAMKLEKGTKSLTSCILRLSVRQVDVQNVSGFLRLGVVNIDLAEYAGSNETKRTYLLEHSRFNSTVNVTIRTDQIRGDVMFRRKNTPGGEQPASNEKNTSPKRNFHSVAHQPAYEVVDEYMRTKTFQSSSLLSTDELLLRL